MQYIVAEKERQLQAKDDQLQEKDDRHARQLQEKDDQLQEKSQDDSGAILGASVTESSGSGPASLTSFHKADNKYCGSNWGTDYAARDTTVTSHQGCIDLCNADKACVAAAVHANGCVKCKLNSIDHVSGTLHTHSGWTTYTKAPLPCVTPADYGIAWRNTESWCKDNAESPWGGTAGSSDAGVHTFGGAIGDDHWKLVRRVKAGSTWHPATDQFEGTDVYGDYDPNHESDSTFSIAFSEMGCERFLVASGDMSVWLIASKDAIAGSFYTYGKRDIVKSSTDSSAYQASWYRRSSQIEVSKILWCECACRRFICTVVAWR